MEKYSNKLRRVNKQQTGYRIKYRTTLVLIGNAEVVKKVSFENEELAKRRVL